jgi:hypothetical protein
VTGGWRKLHNEELRDVYSLPRIIRMIKEEEDEMGKAYSTNWKKRNKYRLLVGNPKEKRPLGIPRRMWVDNIRMGFS